MFVVHSIETYASWTTRQEARRAAQAQRTDKSKFHYDYALGYCRKALNEKRQEIRIGKAKKFGKIDEDARYYPADTDAVDVAQAAYLLWHKSRTGKRVALDTRGACRFAIRNYWRAKHIGRIKGDADDAMNPNGKYAYATISTARKNGITYVQTSAGIPDRETRNLDLETVDMEQTDTNVTTVVRLLSTGATQRDVANQTDLSEMQVSRIVAKLRAIGQEYWQGRKRGEAIPQTSIAIVPDRAPEHYRPIKLVETSEQTVADHSPFRLTESARVIHWQALAQHVRETPTLPIPDITAYVYTENDIATIMPIDEDLLARMQIIYS